MATRRNVPIVPSGEKAAAVEYPTPQRPASNSNISPAVPGSVIFKLLFFTAAMVILPIGTYFATVDVIFKGKAVWAGASAAVMANVVLIGYVIVAMKEDQSDRIAEEESRKGK